MNTPKFHVTATFNGVYSFYECLLFIVNGIRDLGYEVTYADNQLNPDAINIVLGSYSTISHLNSWTRLSQQADNIIIYNWEQVAHDVPYFTQRYFRQMINAHVWDYNLRNIESLKKAGIHDIHHVPMSFVPEMCRAPKVEQQDIDVLFYGIINERRAAILQAMRNKGLKLVTTEDSGWMAGEKRDELIARSKIVLNMHFFDVARVFEIARVSYLLANSKAVVSEIAPNTDIDDDIRAAVVGGQAQDLPQLCWDLIHDDARRHDLGRKAFELFSQRHAAHALKPAIERYLAQLNAKPAQLGNPPEHSVALPKILQIGAAEKWNFMYCNIDANANFAPDLPIDISQPVPFEQPLHSWRFGHTTLTQGYFDKIIAKNVFQRVSNLQQALTNCLELLSEGGIVELSVPLDLSLDSWSSLEDCRTFNSSTWEKLLDEWWTYGWTHHRLEIASIEFGLHNPYGMGVLKDNANDWDSALRMPRAIDTMNVVLRKRALTNEETELLPQARFLD
ncbi:hypothetical protein [Hydromonas duriensis]|uniref:Uncharacterized protein n=1 Tax=Hydromonas duriensis TaxID=1527608 RepID=A0A4R6Y6S5_9BURK|nr:hypothetical protein [Hydromonas duriensis]TDR31007.1 hypothetical protein DFR44_11444 [Hydromonas duriensis]